MERTGKKYKISSKIEPALKFGLMLKNSSSREKKITSLKMTVKTYKIHLRTSFPKKQF